MTKKRYLKYIFPLLSVTFWVALWWVTALLLGKPMLLPTPWRVLCKLFSLCKTSAFWSALGLSLWRIVGGILTALALGSLLAAATTKCRPIHHLFSPLLTLFKATPVAAVIFLLLLFLGRKSVPFFITLTVTLPIVWGNMREGLVNADGDLPEMAHVFGLSPLKILWRIRLPMLRSYFKGACLSAIGLGFKAGVAAEILCLPGGSLGALMYESKLYLKTEELFAYTLAVILISVVIEKLTVSMLSHPGEKEAKHHA